MDQMRDVQDLALRLGDSLAQVRSTAGERILAVRAPARSEIAGNHTDHEGGRVIAGALDRSIECLAVANDGLVARVFSEGHKPVEIALDELDPRPEERVTSAALVRGMAAQLVGTGRTPAGFDLVMASDIPAGGGLSSSAAYELALCRALEALWPGRPIDAVEAAQMAQRVEQDWFGRPCGLMDQLAVSMGGLAYMDFAADVPQTQSLSLDFVDHGFMLCLTDVGCDHSAYTDEHAAVPTEMRAVARTLGGERLGDVSEESLYQRLGELRTQLGDRMVLRALHYWQEMELVDARWEALCAGDLRRFLLLTERSGASSAMFLQNVSVGGSVRQDAMVALALSTRLLHGRGATRIHGGGFGGSIQAFVPVEELDAYRMSMDRLLGDGACKAYRISTEGAQAQWL
jgi:galactokinase